MHPLIASLTCALLLLTGGRAESEEFQYQKNVPEEAKSALLDAIKEERKTLPESLGTIEYDENLAKKAHEGDIDGPLSVLDGKSTFETSWKETLKRALSNSKNKGKTILARKIGCKIKLTTDADGSHNVELNCCLGDKDGNLLRVGSNGAQL